MGNKTLTRGGLYPWADLLEQEGRLGVGGILTSDPGEVTILVVSSLESLVPSGLTQETKLLHRLPNKKTASNETQK